MRASDDDALVARLVGDLRPARRLRARDGGVLVAAVAAATLGVVLFGLGMRGQLGDGDPVSLVTSGAFAVLAIAAASTVIAMARPQVGNRHDGWAWAAAMVALLPAGALVRLLTAPEAAQVARHGGDCVMTATLLGAGVMAALTWWLRRGAPTDPARAGLLTGVAGGAVGAFALAFHCANDELAHIGLSHVAAVLLCALVGRVLVPRVIRW